MSRKIGRPCKPSALKVVQGNIQNLNINEPLIIVDDQWAPPEELSPAQKVEWKYAIDNCPPGMLGTLDRDALKMWTAAVVGYNQCLKAYNEVGAFTVIPARKESFKRVNGYVRTTTYPGYRVMSRELEALNKQSLVLLRMVSELGFSPTSRQRVYVQRGGAKENAFKKNASSRAA